MVGETTEGHVVVTRRIPGSGLELLREAGASVEVVQTEEERGVEPGPLREAVGRCEVLLSLLTERIDRELLSVGARLRGVANMAVGYDNVDVEAATELGVPVSNTPGVLTDTTADFTWAMLMAVARKVPQAHAYMADGRYRLWGPNLFLGSDVSPGGSGRVKTLGVVGFGRIGRAVARRALGFEMRVVAFDPYEREGVEASDHVSWSDLDRLLEESDFVTLHPPLTEETHHLIGEAELRAMKPGAFLINASRGPVVDERALVRALDEGWIAGAALDVYEEEPEMAPGLAELPNVALFPHVASASHDTRGRMAEMAAENAVAHLEGRRAPNCVNPEVYDSEPYRRRVGGLL